MLIFKHIHRFSWATSFDSEHLHIIAGSTGPELEQGPAHTHRIRVTTTVEDANYHRVDIVTGPEIATPWGHIHYFSGFTSVSGTHPHFHSFKNVTGLPLGNITESPKGKGKKPCPV